MRIRWSVGVLLGFAQGSCSEAEAPKAPSPSEEGTAAKYLTTEEIVQGSNRSEPSSTADFTFGFETRDHQLWLHTSTDPQLYTVKAKDGKVVADAIDDSRLKLDYPDLHEIVHSAVDLIGIGYSER